MELAGLVLALQEPFHKKEQRSSFNDLDVVTKITMCRIHVIDKASTIGIYERNRQNLPSNFHCNHGIFILKLSEQLDHWKSII